MSPEQHMENITYIALRDASAFQRHSYVSRSHTERWRLLQARICCDDAAPLQRGMRHERGDRSQTSKARTFRSCSDDLCSPTAPAQPDVAC